MKNYIINIIDSDFMHFFMYPIAVIVVWESIKKICKYIIFRKEREFNKMFNFITKFFIAVNFDANFEGIKYECGKKIPATYLHNEKYKILDKIFNLELSTNMKLYGLFLKTVPSQNGIKIKITYSDNDILNNREVINKFYIDILKQELPKILNKKVFDGKKLII